MKLFAIVCALLVCIYTSEAMWREESISHEATEIDCAGRRSELAENMLEVMCKPRPTLVPLTPQLGYVFHPNYVSVNRCSGYCPNMSCMPTRYGTKNVTVKQMAKYVSELQCYHVVVEQHIKCKCKCMVKESDCNRRQEYDEK
nr:PREDICTED: vascular endothelial growth factor B-like [Linepithema humile]